MADNSAPLVVVFPRGQLTELDKARMEEAGIIAVEADDPEAVQQLHLAAPLVNTTINGDAIVSAALRAITGGSSSDQSEMNRASFRFVKHLADSLKEAPDAQQ